MGLTKHLRQQWNEPANLNLQLWKERILAWRREPSTIRIEKPTRLDRARAIGYVSKPGIIVVRQRVTRGGHRRERYRGGKRSKRTHTRLMLNKNYRLIAEARAAKKYSNCEVLNSYFVAKDGKHYWYEVILADRTNPHLLSDPRYSWLAKPANKGRVFRGLTSAGKRSRGLRWKGRGAEKARPSKIANWV